MIGHRKHMRLFAGLLGSVSLAATAHAQPAEADDATPALEEIVVTAQKRSENLHNVPISVGALSSDTIADSGIKRLDDVQFKVPNFTIGENPIGTAISIRGIFSGVNQGFEQSVGIYIDGIHYGRAQQSRAPFLDLERIEVLRGPQSILFGKNSIAGALNITTATPKNQFGGYVNGSYSPNHNDWETAGAIGGPISDKVRLRVAGRYHRSDGYYENRTLDRDEAQRKDWQLRGVIEADLTDRLKVSLKAEAGSFDVKGRELETFGNFQSIAPTPLFGAGPFGAGLTYGEILTNSGTVPVNTRIAGINASTGMQLLPLPVASSSVSDMTADGKRHAQAEFSNNKTQTYVLKADYELGAGTMTAISGYSRFKYDELCDCDMTGAEIFNAGIQEEYSQFSQEIRYVSDKGNTVDYILGGFFQTSEDKYSDQINVSGASPLIPLVFNQTYAAAYESAFGAWLAGNPGDLAGATTAGRSAGAQAGAAGLVLANTQASRKAEVDAKLWSLFGQLTWNASDKLRVTFGSRLNHEKKTGQRNMRILSINGAPLTGMQELVAPLSYAGVFHIASSNLTEVAAAGVPGISAQAAGAIAAYGNLPVDGRLSKWKYTPSLTLQFEPNRDIMLYASWVKGAKSGGFDYRANNRGASATMAEAFEFADEKASSYEAGAKIKFLDGRAELNTAVYYTDYRDLQISVFDGTLGFNVGNAARARLQGLEADARFAVTSNLVARASIAFSDFKFKEYRNGECYQGQTTDITNAALRLCDYSGKSNQFVADVSGTFALDYHTMLTSDLELNASSDLFYTSSYFTAATLDPSTRQSGNAKINARIAIASDKGGWELAVLGKNLTDRTPLTFSSATPLAYNVFGTINYFGLFSEGRTFAVQARVKF